ncbi:MAG TPA: hypothetical protein VMA53_21170 [Stellaceae bacterium]|nr:hypothetical protein [Stellaceae bacterium]
MEKRLATAFLFGLGALFWLTQAGAQPKFVGSCINKGQVIQLFQKYRDVEQIGPWNTEEIQARKKAVTNPSTQGGLGGSYTTSVDKAERTLLLTRIPSGKTIVATICGALQEGKRNAVAEKGEENLYPMGKPGHWCAYGGPKKGVCSEFSQSWFQSYDSRGPSVHFVNAATTYLYGFVWAYVRPTEDSD